MNLLSLISILINTKCDLDPRASYQNGNHLHNGHTFDFIVIGAGSAGSVVANRLSENKANTVLLLEAGGYPTVSTEVPAYWVQNLNSERNWNFELEPGNYSLSNSQKTRYPRGKVLGGTSSINGMVYVHSLPSDYNTWASLGNPGWDFQSVLKYFKKAENLVGVQNGNFGTGGPITIMQYPTNNSISEMIKKALGEIGVPVLKEEGGSGIFPTYNNIQNGTRCSTARGYLSNLKRNNLWINTKAYVMQILFTRNRATGVKVSIDGRVINLNARKEIILSGGVINSPQILLLSGIGPAEDLKELGIPVKADLPVGKSMMDHYLTRGFFIKLKPSTTENICLSDAVLEYCLKRDGPINTLGPGALEWSLNTKNQSVPDMFLSFAYSAKDQPDSVKNILTVFTPTNETLQQFYELNSKNDILLIIFGISTPKSTGFVKLRSTNPFEKPLIFPNFLSDANNEDLQTFVATIDYIKRMVDSPAMKELNAELVMPDFPNCKKFVVDSPDFYACVIRNLEGTGGHTTSTCRMGPKNNPTSVVDDRLRVYGITSLRVVDASVMPTVPNRNTNAPTIMIAEKASDMIKEDWNQL